MSHAGHLLGHHEGAGADRIAGGELVVVHDHPLAAVGACRGFQGYRLKDTRKGPNSKKQTLKHY